MLKLKYVVKLLFATVLVGCIFITSVGAIGSGVPYESYSIWEKENSKTVVSQPDCFTQTKMITGMDLGLGEWKSPSALAEHNGYLYVLDSEASRIIVLGNNYKLEKVIKGLTFEGKDISFNGAEGLFIADDGSLYIADTQNERVIILNNSYQVIKIILKPKTNAIPETLQFQPIAVTMDNHGYLMVLCKSCYYGAMIFDENGEFLNFFGSNPVSASVLGFVKDLIGKAFITDKKRDASVQALPFAFDDLCFDNGFLYTVSSQTGSNKGQIRKLSLDGTNIYGGSGFSDTLRFGTISGTRLATGGLVSRLSAIDVDDDGNVYVLDSAYGRVYVYDNQCELLTVFGGGLGSGIQKGTFESATDIEIKNDDCIVLDSSSGSITVFNMTDYGKKFFCANALSANGDYEKSYDYWTEINKTDIYNQKAYTGIARALLNRNDYKGAMEYAKKGDDGYTYQLAFYQLRQNYIQNHFLLIFLGAVLLITLIAVSAVLARRNAGISLIKNEKVLCFKQVIFHPVDSFTAVKQNGLGSAALATISLLLLYVTKVVSITSCGYMYRTFDRNKYNSLLTLCGTVGVALLFILINYLISTLMAGRGFFKDVYIVVGYSVLPLTIYNLVYLVLSNILVYDEQSIFSVLSAVAWILTIAFVLIGLSIVHDYEFGSMCKTIALTLICMAIAIFLLMLLLTLFQNLYSFFRSIFTEYMLRRNIV